jgi:RNA polymerase sigma factor (sigma-70 family)
MEDAILHRLIAGCLKQKRKDRKMLYQTFYGFAMGICARYTDTCHEPAEIMNHGFIRIFESLRRYDPKEPFKEWFRKSFVNGLVDHYLLNYQLLHADSSDESGDNLPGVLADTGLKQDHLLSMIRRLPHAIRISYNLYVIEGYTFEETAVLLKINVRTVQLNLASARYKLTQMILAHQQLL